MIFGEKLKFRYGQNNIFSLKKKKKKKIYTVDHDRVIRSERQPCLESATGKRRREGVEKLSDNEREGGVRDQKGFLSVVIDDPTQDIGPLFLARYLIPPEILFLVGGVSHAAPPKNIAFSLNRICHKSLMD